MCINHVIFDSFVSRASNNEEERPKSHFMINDDKIYITDNNSYRGVQRTTKRAQKKKSITNGTIQRTHSKADITQAD